MERQYWDRGICWNTAAVDLLIWTVQMDCSSPRNSEPCLTLDYSSFWTAAALSQLSMVLDVRKLKYKILRFILTQVGSGVYRECSTVQQCKKRPPTFRRACLHFSWIHSQHFTVYFLWVQIVSAQSLSGVGGRFTILFDILLFLYLLCLSERTAKGDFKRRAFGKRSRLNCVLR